jgi:hypothetical protein
MARKATADSESTHGFNDIIGLVLLVFALLLFFAQLSFDRYDLKAVKTPPNESVHNLIGPAGAHVAHAFFFMLGAVAFFVPPLLALFGLSYVPEWMRWLRLNRVADAIDHFRERWRWHLLWAFVFVVAWCGLLHMMKSLTFMENLALRIWSPSAGGWLGLTLYDFGFWMLGRWGATIVYCALCLISALFLTNFQLGLWVRGFFPSDAEVPETRRDREKEKISAEEQALERKARELQKQAKQLQEEVEVARSSGLGADGLPVPEPTDRDLSVPQAKPRGR